MNRFQHSSLSRSSSVLQKSIPEIYCSCDLSIIPTKTKLEPAAKEVESSNDDLSLTIADADNDPNDNHVNNPDCEPPSSFILSGPNRDNQPAHSTSATNPAATPTLSTCCQTTAYFRDTQSKRSKVVIPVLLSFDNKYDRKALLRSGAIQPPPSNNENVSNTKLKVERRQQQHQQPSLTSTSMSMSASYDEYDDNMNSMNSMSSLNSMNNSNSSNTGFSKSKWQASQSSPSGLSDGSELWSSELDTLGEARGESSETNDSEKLELKFECSCMNLSTHNNYRSSNGDECNDETVFVDYDDDEDDDDDHDDGGDFNTNKDKTIIEGVKILSTFKIDKEGIIGIRFDVEVSIRSPLLKHTNNTHHTPRNKNKNEEENKSISNDEVICEEKHHPIINKTRLKLRSKLVCTSFKPTDDERNFFDAKRSYQSIYDLESHTTKFSSSGSSAAAASGENIIDNIFLAKQALDMGVNSISPYENEGYLPESSYFARSLSYLLPSSPQMGLVLDLDIVPAVNIEVREISGASSNTGVTLVSLVISHSNLHNEDVTITNIALHPGHSRLSNNNPSKSKLKRTTIMNSNNNEELSTNIMYNKNEGMTIPGGENSVINMIKYVRWGYVQGTAPSLPLVLKPQEAIATVIQINASEPMTSRTFVSPICVRGVVDGKNCHSSICLQENDNDTSDGELADTYRDEDGHNTSMIMVSADARWTTAPMVTGKADAYRINLSVQETQCNVGSQVVVSLKVMNLSDETRNLTLIMAKEEVSSYDSDEQRKKKIGGGAKQMNFTGGNVQKSSDCDDDADDSSGYSAIGVNNAVVCEVNGYTFGVWGLSGQDDGTVRYSRDHELLAVDAALLLGEVKGQHSIDAELRFVPLREGILDVPNLCLFDNYNQSWYDCVHSLKIISVSS